MAKNYYFFDCREHIGKWSEKIINTIDVNRVVVRRRENYQTLLAALSSVKSIRIPKPLNLENEEKGRQVEANSALYWHSIVQAKHSGCRWFDVGGLSDETPKGIADFKRGLNGTPYQLVGEWRGWLWKLAS